jgi:hypothetical protein
VREGEKKKKKFSDDVEVSPSTYEEVQEEVDEELDEYETELSEGEIVQSNAKKQSRQRNPDPYLHAMRTSKTMLHFNSTLSELFKMNELPAADTKNQWVRVTDKHLTPYTNHDSVSVRRSHSDFLASISDDDRYVISDETQYKDMPFDDARSSTGMKERVFEFVSVSVCVCVDVFVYAFVCTYIYVLACAHPRIYLCWNMRERERESE